MIEEDAAPELKLAPAAESFLNHLWRSDRGLAERVDDGIAWIPDDHRSRTRSIRREAGMGAPVWGFVVRGRDDDVLVLWEPVGDAVWIHYIGPDVD